MPIVKEMRRFKLRTVMSVSHDWGGTGACLVLQKNRNRRHPV